MTDASQSTMQPSTEKPWLHEPNELFTEVFGYRIALIRSPLGAWNGYVGVPKGHPLYGAHYSESVRLDTVDVHGGLTYSGFGEDLRGTPQWVANLWCLGFDCAHWDDLVPGLEALVAAAIGKGGTYRDMGYVLMQATKLAAQVRAIESQQYEQEQIATERTLQDDDR